MSDIIFDLVSEPNGENEIKRKCMGNRMNLYSTIVSKHFLFENSWKEKFA